MKKISAILLVISLVVGQVNFVMADVRDSSPKKKLNSFIANSFFSASTKITNTHMWRGFKSGNAPCVEPTITYKNNGFSFSAWAAYAFDNSYKEVDIYVTYDYKYFQVGLYDYYCPSAGVTTNEFTDFVTADTKHIYEVQLNFMGHKYFPVNVITSCFVGGDDKDGNNQQLYSSYIEVNYDFNFKKNNLKFEVGMTPFNKKSMYASKASVFNYGITLSRDIQVTNKWSIPSSYKVIYNKETKDVYFSVGFTLR